MEQQIIPDGYKQSEFGPIPKEWNCYALSHFINQLVAGISVNSVETDDVSGQKCVLKTSCIYRGVFTDIEAKLIAPKDIGRAKLNPVKGAILVSRMNTPALVGEIGYIDKDYEDRYLPDRLWQTTFKRNVELDSKWLSYCLSYKPVSQIIKEAATGTSDSMKNISKDSFLSVVVPVPTYAEQTAIANALSDVDALIASIEKLIAKKQAIKTATMQQLLTGKKRLPPFGRYPDGSPKGTKQSELGEIPEDWAFGEWGKFIEKCSSGATPYRGSPEFYKGNIRWISSGELNYNIIEDTIEKISKDAVKRTNLTMHPKGTFLMAITGLEAAGTRGSCGIVGAPSTTNQSCMAVYPKKLLTSEYLFHYYVAYGNELALKYCQGTKQQSYTAALVKRLPIVLPKDVEEQKAIARVLSSMDLEIGSLHNRLAKTQQVKQGMMQELLTGKTRLPVVEDE